MSETSDRDGIVWERKVTWVTSWLRLKKGKK
jgi:hypothetical protein